MSARPVFQEYLAKVERDLQAGNATEHTYRPYLKDLLESLAPGTVATNEPKRVQCGAPDYVVSTRTTSGPATIGYVEAKDVGISLSEIARTDQVRRYRDALDNLVLTNYLDFQWFVDGQERMAARLATLRQGHLIVDHAATEEAEQLLRSFVGRSPELIRSPRVLAERMARITHMIHDIAARTFAVGQSSERLTGLYEAFKAVLLPELTISEFADMFSQTLAYGLFAARVRHTGPRNSFRRQDAAHEIPKTNPFLRELFDLITGPALDDEPFMGFVDDLAQLLAWADMDEILRDFGRRTRQEDPIVHFYETFLAAYDPKLRELRGVYYTPEPVVSYIVRSVDAVLKRDFGLREGLADTSPVSFQHQDEAAGNGQAQTQTSSGALLLDPACGTGTFLYAAIDLMRERFAGNAGMWPGYVQKHLLPRVFGFELLMAPYAVAHLKLGMQLAAMDLPEAQRHPWAYTFEGDERLGVFLTNTLEEAAKKSLRLPLGTFISNEANAAARVKRDAPVMVVMGNPPYSGHSANNGLWIAALLRGEDLTNQQGETLFARGKGKKAGNYFAVDGKPLGERNPKWLNDDYVKFIRFSQWRIETTGYGVLAFITNHGYLDNPTFRGMRQSLMQSFDDIYVLNLHGNAKKKERAPDGGKDENVFDIQQGVAIGIFIRRQRESGSGAARNTTVHYADLYGEREAKYSYLAAQDVRTTGWTQVSPQTPFYLFVPRNIDLEAEYQQHMRVTDMMTVNSVGIVTARDSLTIHWTPDEVWNTVNAFATLPAEEARSRYRLGPDARDWQVALAQKDLKDTGLSKDKVQPVLYRPFDVRCTYYTGTSRGFQCMPRREVMQHMLAGRNLALITSRLTKGETYKHVQATRNIVEVICMSPNTSNNGFVFPLYLYPDLSKPVLMHDEPLPDTPGHRRPNVSPAFIADVAARLRMTWVPDGKGDREHTFGPEDVFSYMYAVFHSPEYRERYADFLKTDFPRLPLTRDPDLFRELCGLGDELVGLHLMERKATPITRYPVPGSNLVERVHYTGPGEGADLGRVWINASQYFEGVPPEVWEFHIGGYQVCEKWLKDRKGRTLSYDDLAHYAQIVAALSETIRLMEAIDDTIEDHGGWPLDHGAEDESEPTQVPPGQ